MFYQCSKCKKIWQYPIKKCPECFSKPQRMPGSKFKVIGISQVNTPTITHPIVPYFVLLLEDENGNRFVFKSAKEYKIGDEFKIDNSDNKDKVAIWRIKYDIKETIEKMFDFFDNITIKENSKILILPTLISPKHSYLAENTSPLFIDNLIKYLISKGTRPENITLAGQSFNNFPIEICVQKSGLLDVCLKNNIQILDLSKDNFIDKNGLSIANIVFNSDIIINAPILKIGQNSSLENILKFLKKEFYLEHQQDQKDLIINLVKTLPQFFTLADGSVIQKKNGFTIFLGIMMGSFNPFNLERVFSEICMEDSLTELVSDIKIEDIPVVGRNIKEIQYKVNEYI